ncbi:MAG: hypothetical protein VW518_05850 [Burkholderiaceae bacterium]
MSLLKMVEDTHPVDENGVIRIYTFSSGYQLSAVKFCASYGGDQNLWEIAVMNKNRDFVTGDFFPDECKSDSYGADVIGYVDNDKLKNYVQQLEEL